MIKNPSDGDKLFLVSFPENWIKMCSSVVHSQTDFKQALVTAVMGFPSSCFRYASSGRSVVHVSNHDWTQTPKNWGGSRRSSSSLFPITPPALRNEYFPFLPPICASITLQHLFHISPSLTLSPPPLCLFSFQSLLSSVPSSSSSSPPPWYFSFLFHLLPSWQDTAEEASDGGSRLPTCLSFFILIQLETNEEKDKPAQRHEGLIVMLSEKSEVIYQQINR